MRKLSKYPAALLNVMNSENLNYLYFNVKKNIPAAVNYTY